MATSVPTHFRCSYHDVVLPNDLYQAHVDESHDGQPIAVMFEAVTDLAMERAAAAMQHHAKTESNYGCVDWGDECPWHMGEVDWRELARLALDAAKEDG